VPVPGRPRNPEGELPLRFRDVPHMVVEIEGESPGTKETSLRGSVLAPGIVRSLWRQTAGFIGAAPDYSWTSSSPGFSRLRPVGLTRALRYMARSFYLPAGSDETRWGAPRPYQEHETRQPLTTIGAGTRRNRPTVRNRLSSFGSRVQPIVSRVQAAVDEEAG
jgi:hypothetical protein